jgi:hypothetical protein
MLLQAKRRESMMAACSYAPGAFAFMDHRASLFYFAAAVPAVGFVHGRADVGSLNAAMFESSQTAGCVNRGLGLDAVACREG